MPLNTSPLLASIIAQNNPALAAALRGGSALPLDQQQAMAQQGFDAPQQPAPDDATAAVAAPSYDEQASALKRRMALAEQLRGVKAPTETQMVSGRAVPNSPWVGLGAIGQQLLGGYEAKKADEAQTKLDKSQIDAISGLVSSNDPNALVNALRGGQLGTKFATPLISGILESNQKLATTPRILTQEQAAGLGDTHGPDYAVTGVPGKMITGIAPIKPIEAPSDLAKLIAERDKLPPGSPNIKAYNDAIMKASKPAAAINLMYPKPVETTPELSPIERDRLGGMVATGMPLTQVAPGYGKTAAAKREQARNYGLEKIQEEHPEMTPAQVGEEYANRQIDYLSGKRSSAQLTTQLGSVRPAIAQLDFNINKTTEEMAKLGSTDVSPILNAIARGEQKWTGNPAYSSLFYYMSGAAIEAAKIRSGGTASVAQLHEGARKEAENWASVNMTPAAWKAVAESMKLEGENVIQNYEQALEKQRINHTGRAAPSAAPAAAPTGGIPQGWTVKAH